MESPKGRRHRLPADVQDSEVISCVHRNKETAFERFQNGSSLPGVTSWKNNLTALSQHYNLYFVADANRIMVYRPRGPCIGGKPRMVTQVDLAKQDARGLTGIGGDHAINHLVVGDLGIDEILLFATDSGNIGAYNVDSIASVIDEVEDLGGEQTDPWQVGERVKCFFVQFIQASAWGLSIHKHARMIAVSANDHSIHVFAFALKHAPYTAQEVEQARENTRIIDRLDDQGWPWIRHPNQLAGFWRIGPGQRRLTNLRIQYYGHKDNIPCVTFMNSDIDPGASFMVSISIGNEICIWRTWESLMPLRKIDLALTAPTVGSHHREQRGWGVLALDPRSFRTKSCLNFACPGGKQFHTYEELLGAKLPRANRQTMANTDGTVMDEIDKVLGRKKREQKPKPTSKKLEKLWEQPLDFPGPFLGTSVPLDPKDDAQSIESDKQDSNTSDDSEHQIDWAADPEHIKLLDEYFEQFGVGDYCPSFMDLDPAVTTPGTVHWENEFKLAFKNFPIASFGEYAVTLFRGVMSVQATTLYENVFHETSNISPIGLGWSRINMVHQIPELGVVVAAAQSGHVGIFTMTDVPFEGPTLRIDHVIPTQDQKAADIPLLGIAVGPVESQLNPTERNKWMARSGPVRDNWESRQHPFRRYRLILYYYDQRIDHYELWYDWPDDMRGPTNKWKPNESRWLLVKDAFSGDN